MTRGIGRCLAVALAMAAAPVAARQAPTPARDRLASFAQRTTMERASIVKNLAFRNIGPTSMNGRIVDVEFPDPKNPYTYLIAYASGGVWKTTNNGTTFDPIFDHEAAIIIGDVAVDPRNPNVIWIGTGEANASRSTYAGTGVYRTEDGGKTWTHMGLAETQRIARIIVSPADSRIVWVAAQGPLYTSGPDRGVYKTVDGGKTWKKTLFVDDTTGMADMAIHPQNPKILYAASWTKDRKPWGFTHSGPGSAVWRSDNGGDTWKKLAGGLPSGDFVGRIGLAVSAGAPNVVYATVDNKAPKPDKDQPEPDDAPLTPQKLQAMTSGEFLALEDEDLRPFLRRFNPDDTADKVRRMVQDGTLTMKDLLARVLEQNPDALAKDIIGAQVYRSDDRGETWTLQNQGYLDDVFSTYGYYFADIRVSPRDVNTVYLLGVPLIKSTDGGKTWKAGDGPDVHADHHALWIDPHVPDHLVNGNDGGLNVSWDSGKTWVDVVNVPAAQFYFITVDMARPFNVYGGLQDNGVYFGPSDKPADRNTWTSIGGGDGMQVQVDTRTNQLSIQGSQYGNYRATDRAKNQNWAVKPLSHVNEPYNRYNWQSPVLMSPHTPEIVYFGTQRLYRSFDMGRTFKAISGDLTTNRQPPSSDTPYSTIVTISESPLTFGLVYVGTDDGQVHVTRDSGLTWTNVTRGLAPDRYISRVVASKYTDGVAYVSQSGYRNDDWTAYLWRTSDYGKTWTSITGSLPNETINVIKEDPRQPSLLYVGTDLGVYLTLDGGTTWQALVGGLPHVPVHDLLVHPRDNELVLGTHGRSAYVADVRPVQALLDEAPGAAAGQPARKVLDKALHVFRIDDIQEERMWPREDQRQIPSYFTVPKKDPQALVFYTRTAGPVTLTILDAEGNPVRTLDDDAEVGLNVVAWDYTLEAGLAKKAEEGRKAKAADRKDRKPARPFKDWMTWYVTAGTYTLEVRQGAAVEKTSFKVTPAPAGGRGFFFEPEQEKK